MVGRYGGSNFRQLCCRQSAAEQGDNPAFLAILRRPLSIAFFIDGGKTNLDTQFVGLKQEIFKDRGGFIGGRYFHQDAQRQVIMDHRLADIQNHDLILGQDIG